MHELRTRWWWLVQHRALAVFVLPPHGFNDARALWKRADVLQEFVIGTPGVDLYTCRHVCKCGVASGAMT